MNENCYIDVATQLPDAEPLGRVSINPRVTSMQVRAELNAGYTAGVVGIDLYGRPGEVRPSPILEQPHAVPAFAHVIFHYDGVPVFTGRALIFPWDDSSFEARGYGWSGMVDGVVQSMAPGDPISDGALGRLAIDEAAPFLAPATGLAWIEPTTRHHPAEFRFITPRDGLDMIAKACGQPWVVYDDMRVHLLDSDANPPEYPDYHIPYDRVTVQGSDDFADVYNHVTLIITGTRNGRPFEEIREIPSIYPTVLPPNVTRSFPLHSQAEHKDSAILVAQEWLRLHASPQVPVTVTRSAGAGLERLDGGPQVQYMVKPGQWVQIADRPMQRITRTDWDGWREQLVVTLGQPSPGDIIGVIERAARNATALSGGRDALSLGRMGR